MSFSMYDASVPMFVRMMNNMSFCLDKAETHATARKFDPANYSQLRLAPDMLPFPRQIQIACDAAKLAVARLSGVELAAQEDKETTLPELRSRIATTIELIKSVPADKIAGTEDKVVTWKQRGEPMSLAGKDYLLGVAIPNFFFHVTTAYAILRHNGVELGKNDFLRGKA